MIGGFAVNKVISWNIAGEKNVSLEHLNENPKDVYGFGHIKFYEEIVNEINSDKSKLVYGKEAFKTVEIISAIYKSIKTKKEVIIK